MSSLQSCPEVTIYWVEAYQGGYGGQGRIWHDEMERGEGASGGPVAVRMFSRDKDAAMKRKLTFLEGSANLPDYRYAVTVTRTQAEGVQGLLALLPDFTLADGVSRPVPLERLREPPSSSRMQ